MNQTTSRCVSSLVVNLNFQNYVSCLQDCSRNRDSQIYTLGGELIVHVNVFERRSSDKCQTGLFVLTVTMNQQSVDCFINSIKSAARSLGLIPRDGYTQTVSTYIPTPFQRISSELIRVVSSPDFQRNRLLFSHNSQVHSAVGIFIFPGSMEAREKCQIYLLLDYLERNIARVYRELPKKSPRNSNSLATRG